jgi:hypothetical protein
MDVEQMTECARRAWLKHGVSWLRLSFDQRYEIIREYEAGRPPRSKPAAVKIPVRGADGSSEGIGGGVGKPLDTKPAPKTPGADQHATELMRQAHRELEGEYLDRGGRFDNKVR